MTGWKSDAPQPKPTAYMDYRRRAFDLAAAVETYWDDLVSDRREREVAKATLQPFIDHYRDASVVWGAVEAEAEK